MTPLVRSTISSRLSMSVLTSLAPNANNRAGTHHRAAGSRTPGRHDPDEPRSPLLQPLGHVVGEHTNRSDSAPMRPSSSNSENSGPRFTFVNHMIPVLGDEVDVVEDHDARRHVRHDLGETVVSIIIRLAGIVSTV